MAIAVISDIHGNVTALQAVLADIEARGIETIYNLGDVIGKGPRGSEAVRVSRRRCVVTVRGNWDDNIAKRSDDWPVAAKWWHDELTDEDLQWLSTLPLCHDVILSGRRVRMYHASAQSPHYRVMFHHTAEQFEGMFQATEMTGDGPPPDVVLYGDIHDTYLEAQGGRMLVNVGSVGNSLDEPTAAYVIIEGDLGSEDGGTFGV